SERLVHDLGETLAERGHEVTVLTSHPGRRSTATEDGIRVVRARRLPQPPTFGLNEYHLGNVPNVIGALVRGRFDVAHAFQLSDAWAAAKALRFGGPRFAFSFHGMPTRAHLVNRRYRPEMLEYVLRRASAFSVLSEAAAAPFHRYLLRKPRILPGGVIAGEFDVGTSKADPVTVFSAASLGDPRKRGALLLEAFSLLRQSRHDLRLRIARTEDPHLSPYRLELPTGAEWSEPRTTAEIAREYASASASVLASEEEAFGLVLVESLAAGTPVVAARSGACPEIVDDPRLGTLFDGDDPAALAAAIETTIALATQQETRERCIARGREFDWSRVVERYEEVYDLVA
ncbi:MAG: glycosyltransferase family 4 protein, partial [Actinobacteria bacterium]|nr:glycosyltransferase family 4 protein [Actinomycetota bacterium]